MKTLRARFGTNMRARLGARFATVSRSRKVWSAVGALALAAAPIVWAQGRNRQATYFAPNATYDGRYTFVRIKYEMTASASRGFRGQDIKWAHDYPRGERHFAKIVNELSTIRAREAESNILTLDDPELGKYPIANLCEPGFWLPSDAEVVGLRNYLTKGGMIIFDDFFNDAWYNFETQIKRVFPNVTFLPLTPQDVVFDSFYRIPKLDLPYMGRGETAQYFGIFEDNDRTKRLMAIINYNNDLSEYWEFSDEGTMPIDMTNEAYKIGINYVIYALTR